MGKSSIPVDIDCSDIVDGIAGIIGVCKCDAGNISMNISIMQLYLKGGYQNAGTKGWKA